MSGDLPYLASELPAAPGDSDQKIVYIYLLDASLKEEAERALTEEYGYDFLAGREVRVRWTPSLRQPEGQIKRVSHPYARFHHA